MRRRSLLILSCLPIFSATTVAQPKDAPKAVVKTTDGNVKPAKDPEAERILKERRANAQSLLISLAADARNFSDQTLRARTQARIAGALWEADRERARTMFRGASFMLVVALLDAPTRARNHKHLTRIFVAGN